MIASAIPAPRSRRPDLVGLVVDQRRDHDEDRADHERRVRDLARQPELVQVDPDQRHERRAEAPERRQHRVGAELQPEQHEQRRVGQLDDERLDADRGAAVPALAAQRQPAHHRHQVERRQPVAARSTRARRRHDRRPARHTIDHDRQERADHQPHHDARDHHQCRLIHAVSKLTGHDPSAEGNSDVQPRSGPRDLAPGHGQLRCLRPPHHRRPSADGAARRHAV